MTNALTAAVQSMQGDLQYLDTISQNIVNIATPGYRRAIPASAGFDAALHTAGIGGMAAAAAPSTALQPLFDLSAGPVKQTGKPFDLAIGGDGYFEVDTPQGLSYTRAGDFHLGADGRLLSANGQPVQGLGGDIVLNGADASIDDSGQITQDGAIVGQLKIVQFGAGTRLLKTAGGLLQPAAGGSGSVVLQPQLQTGHLEGSNVTPMREMVMMMETTRHFEAAQKLYQGYDEVLGSAIQKLGEF